VLIRLTCNHIYCLVKLDESLAKDSMSKNIPLEMYSINVTWTCSWIIPLYNYIFWKINRLNRLLNSECSWRFWWPGSGVWQWWNGSRTWYCQLSYRFKTEVGLSLCFENCTALRRCVSFYGINNFSCYFQYAVPPIWLHYARYLFFTVIRIDQVVYYLGDPRKNKTQGKKRKKETGY